MTTPADVRSEAAVPASQKVDRGPLQFDVRWERSAPGRLQARLHVELPAAELDPAQTALFREHLRSLWAAASSGATYTPATASTGR